MAKLQVQAYQCAIKHMLSPLMLNEAHFRVSDDQFSSYLPPGVIDVPRTISLPRKTSCTLSDAAS